MDLTQLAERYNNLIATYLQYANIPGYENYLYDLNRQIEETGYQLQQWAEISCDNQGYIVNIIPRNTQHHRPQYSYNQNPVYNRNQTTLNYYNRPVYNNNLQQDYRFDQEDRYGKISSKVPSQSTYKQQSSTSVQEEPKEKIFIPGHKYPYLVSDNMECKEDNIGNDTYQWIVVTKHDHEDRIKYNDIKVLESDLSLEDVWISTEVNNNISIYSNGFKNIKRFNDDDQLDKLVKPDNIYDIDLSLFQFDINLNCYKFYKSYYTTIFNILAKMKIVKKDFTVDDIIQDLQDIDRDLIKQNRYPEITSMLSKLKTIILGNLTLSGIFSEQKDHYITIPIVMVSNSVNQMIFERIATQKYKSSIYKISELSSQDMYHLLKRNEVSELLKQFGYICLTYRHENGSFRYRIITNSEIEDAFFITSNSSFI